MRRLLGMVPLAPVALVCVTLGDDALLRDFTGRARRAWAELVDDIERNR